MALRRKAPEKFRIEDGLWKRTFSYEEQPLLTLSLRYPKLPEDTPGLRRIGRYYQQAAQQWKARWEGCLYTRALTGAKAACEASRPFRCWDASLTYSVTLLQDGLLSLYLDAYEYTGGSHGLTVRRGDTWQVPNGIPRTLSSFFPPRTRWRAQVCEEVRRQIRARIHSAEALFSDDWEQRLAPEFDPENFYLTPEGITVFFPLYTIAPLVEGIPSFQLSLPEQP